ncbi:MAG: hypothetical protein ACFFBD_06525 [Candidatus Hodarchaeota archaeon]
MFFGVIHAFWRSGLLLSHHPSCGGFEDHVFHIGRLRLCQGCLCLYSGFISTLVFWGLASFVWKIDWTLNFIEALIIAFIFFSPTFLQIAGLFKRRIFKIITRFLLGVGAFFGFYSIFHLPGLLIFFIPQALLIYFMIWGGVSVWRSFKMQDDCAKCTFSQELPRCVGMKDLHFHLSQVPNLREAFPLFAQSLGMKQEAEDELNEDITD